MITLIGDCFALTVDAGVMIVLILVAFHMCKYRKNLR